jgi:8-hydroxy-5-deazaflavin:NADPH oxidoreductase
MTEARNGDNSNHSGRPTIGIIGGTGKEGSGLGFRWAAAGYRVILGGRVAAKAIDIVEELNSLLPTGANAQALKGADNTETARNGDIVVLAVPYSAQAETALSLLPYLKDKILIDVTVPLVPPRVDRVQLPPGGSAIAALQEKLGDAVKVVSAFQNVSAWHLRDLDHPIECDVLVSGNDLEARNRVIELAANINIRAFDAGPIANSVVAEALTSVLITINRRYKVKASGIKITGLSSR